MVETTEKNKNQRPKKMLMGSVISNKMDKTLVVQVERTYKHPVFPKTVRSYKKYKVHDENGQAHVGDLVEFYEGRPYSKTKHANLSRIIKSFSK